MKPEKLTYEKYREMFGSDGVTTENKNVTPNKFLESLKSVKDGNYGQNMVSKSKFTVRGSLLGLVGGAAISMYYKKSLFFGAILGAIAGTALGNIYGDYINKKNKKKEIKNQE